MGGDWRFHVTASKDSEMFPRGYVAVLHDMVAAYHDKLAEFIPPAELERFRASVAERIVKNLTWKDDEKWHEKVTELLADWGFTVKTENKFGGLQCKIDCPYAHIVHPSTRHQPSAPSQP